VKTIGLSRVPSATIRAPRMITSALTRLATSAMGEPVTRVPGWMVRVAPLVTWTMPRSW
jgi:hypothetical protein